MQSILISQQRKPFRNHLEDALKLQNLNHIFKKSQCLYNLTRRVWVYWTVTVTVFTQTLSLHPALTALVVSSQAQHSDWTDGYFTPVACFLVSLILIN